jgi:hypothetical protein
MAEFSEVTMLPAPSSICDRISKGKVVNVDNLPFARQNLLVMGLSLQRK